MISFYILSEIFFEKRKELSDTRIVSLTKQEHEHSIKAFKSFK